MKVEQTRLAAYPWQAGDPAHDMVCQGDVAAAIAATAFENFRRFSRGGLEIGGILLGRRIEAGLSVQRWLPIECEHARGPAFLLSERDEEALSVSLAEGALCGLEVIGWFVSQSRSALALSDSGLEIFNRFFPEAWQVVLLIKPEMNASVRARICSRNASGIVFGPEFRFDSVGIPPAKEISRPVPAGKVLPAPEPEKAVRVRRLELPAAASPERPSGIVEPPRFVAVKPAAGSIRWMIVALATLCFLLTALVFAPRLSVLLPGSAAGLGLRAIDTGSRLRVEWNSASPLIHEAQHATVEVNDGGRAAKLLLNTSHLRMGSFEYVRQSNDVEFVLTLHRANQPSVQEWTRFIAHSAATSQEGSTPDPAALDRIRELEDENRRLNAALQEETAKRIRQEQAVRILRQHLQLK